MREQLIIEKEQMMEPMLAACPSFRGTWDRFLSDWSGDPSLLEDDSHKPLPYYLVLSDLANHLIAQLETGDTNDFPAVFTVVEDWIVRGSHYVSEAAVVGLLEDLTNEARYRKKRVSDFMPWMGVMTKKWLPEIIDFWERLDKGQFRPLSID